LLTATTVLNNTAAAAGASAGTATGLAVSTDGTLYASNGAGLGIFRSLNPSAVSSVTGASQSAWDLMGTLLTSTLTGTFDDVEVASAAAGNTLYAVNTPTAAVTSYGYIGAIKGITDTFIVAPTALVPASGALLTTTTTATISWTGLASAPVSTTNYTVLVNTSSAFTGTAKLLDTGTNLAGVGAVSATVGNVTTGAGANVLASGTTYYFSIKASAPMLSRSATSSFITALPVVAPPATALFPLQGAVDVVNSPTFTWPAVTGATGYQFVWAEEIGQADKFAIINGSANTTANAYKLPTGETLKYNTLYWWRVRPVSATTTGDWSVFFFTTGAEPTSTTTTTTGPSTTVTPITITTITKPADQITVTIPPSTNTTQPIPSYLLWAVVAVGAILIIVVIVLIVRTRRIS